MSDFVTIWETPKLNGEDTESDTVAHRTFEEAMDYLLENMADHADRKYTEEELEQHGYFVSITPLRVDEDYRRALFGGASPTRHPRRTGLITSSRTTSSRS